MTSTNSEWPILLKAETNASEPALQSIKSDCRHTLHRFKEQIFHFNLLSMRMEIHLTDALCLMSRTLETSIEPGLKE